MIGGHFGPCGSAARWPCRSNGRWIATFFFLETDDIVEKGPNRKNWWLIAGQLMPLRGRWRPFFNTKPRNRLVNGPFPQSWSCARPVNEPAPIFRSAGFSQSHVTRWRQQPNGPRRESSHLSAGKQSSEFKEPPKIAGRVLGRRVGESNWQLPWRRSSWLFSLNFRRRCTRHANATAVISREVKGVSLS